MPIYLYECPQHGEFELIKRMNGNRFTDCPRCNSKAEKLMPIVAFDRKSVLGTTRQELFDNLAKDGNGNRDWRDYDSYYHRATGNEDALNQ